jgi:hypothetical protein
MAAAAHIVLVIVVIPQCFVPRLAASAHSWTPHHGVKELIGLGF